MTKTPVRAIGRGMGYAAAMAAGVYAVRVGASWLRYGHVTPAPWRERDALLDCFMPWADVAERHRIYIEAPAKTALAAACEVDFDSSALVNGIFKARALILGAAPAATGQPRGLVNTVTALGWRILIERPGRELVFGAVTRPWEANVVFHPIAPEEFGGFDDPGFVKIAWTLRADPIDARQSILRTETRAVATDAVARRKFRRYWSLFSPGIVLIRHALLVQVRREAERRARASTRPPRDRFELASVGDLDPQC
jgi:hypothetical protein